MLHATIVSTGRTDQEPVRALQHAATCEQQWCIIQQALSGERSALQALVRHFTPIIQATAARGLSDTRSRGRGAHEVEDITQEVLLKLFGSKHSRLLQWSPERGLSLAGYIRMVTRHEVIDALRSRRRNALMEEPTEAEQLERSGRREVDLERRLVHRQELASLVSLLRKRLSPAGFEIFDRLWLKAQSVEQVCSATGQTPASVYQWRRRIRLLADAVQPQCDRPFA